MLSCTNLDVRFAILQVVNVLALWTILLVTDYSTVATPYTLVYMAVCCAVIGYEVVLGIVRVQDYYTMRYVALSGVHGCLLCCDWL